MGLISRLTTRLSVLLMLALLMCYLSLCFQPQHQTHVPTLSKGASLIARFSKPSESECSLPLESRFNCARDRVLSQTECEERSCCYAPIPHAVPGAPWCFYPPSYSGYRMGPLIPTSRGLAATLKRPAPSYLPKDIPTLRLEVLEETAGRLHLTVSLAPFSPV